MGLFSGLSNIVSSGLQVLGQWQNDSNGTTANNNFNAEQAQINRDWQERLSNTAHRREVQDLIAAGFNPLLTTQGSGASTPSGATATATPGSGANLSDIATATMGGMQAWSAKKLNDAKAGQSEAETDFTKGVKSDEVRKNIELMQDKMKTNAAQRALMGSEQELNIANKGLATTQTTARKGHVDYIAGKLLETTSQAIDNANNIPDEEKNRLKKIAEKATKSGKKPFFDPITGKIDIID